MPRCSRNTASVMVLGLAAAILGHDPIAAADEIGGPARLVGPGGIVIAPATTSSDDEPVPLEQCTQPGTIKVTPRALESARRFAMALPAGWIVVFAWYDGQRVRASKAASWVEAGPRVDFGAFKTSQVPAQAIYREGPFPYAVLIRREIVDGHPERTVDLDAGGHMVFR